MRFQNPLREQTPQYNIARFQMKPFQIENQNKRYENSLLYPEKDHSI
jgi:hypothetical protein